MIRFVANKMPINFQQQKIFIHIPKNAGTSITRSWQGFAMEGHHTVEFYKVFLKNKFEDYETFCVIRDPMDRFVSNYNYARATKSFWHDVSGNAKYGKHPDYDKVVNLSLEETAVLLDKEQEKFGIHWYPQSYWISSGGEISIDKIYNFETIEKDLLQNYNIKLKTLNKIERSEIEISKKTLEIIRKIYKEDYELIDKMGGLQK